MSALINTILDAADLGYAIKIKKELGYYRITCIEQRSNTSSSSVIPRDHFDDPTVSEIIDFNIRKHKEEYVNKRKSSS